MNTAETAISRDLRAAPGLFSGLCEGAGLSVGDLHFSQGDGEITFCGAIEMAGWIHLRVNLIKRTAWPNAASKPDLPPSPITPNTTTDL